MATISMMYWNIENLGTGKTGKYTVSGPQLMDLIARIARNNNASIIALNEIRSLLGITVGKDIATRLNGGLGSWDFHASPTFMKGRNEQYTFVWNKTRFPAVTFQYKFPDPTDPTKNLGFPTQPKSARPPMLGYFKEATGAKKTLRVAAFHAPSPGYWNGVRNGNRALGSVAEFTGGDVCVVMGDCNIKFNANSYVNLSRGEQAFDDLRRAGVGFTQGGCDALNDPTLTSLKKANSGFPTMGIDDAYSEPFDQIFVRDDIGVSINYAGRDELLADCLGKKYVGPYLRNIQYQRTGASPLKYANVDHAFENFRRGVSDHMPMILDLTY